ncbi:MAG TPA: ThiF family adenylyltransferase [Gammaproteobacteria bacterium]|nr:ThiF family adenylyltransferase [Gammaproteobacteria bacterium]
MNDFRFTCAPIDAAAEAGPLAAAQTGGFASFEGRVRDHNEGRAVAGLDYEAFEELAIAEGGRIVTEAVRRHGATGARCVHRLGALAIGDVAVWVGAASAHRAEAFAACREIIDEIKHRLPIWKREHYADGSRHWVNCEGCAEPVAAFDYSRQTALPEIGEEGQRRLAGASVVVVGAGGLGSAVLTALAGAGVGTIHVIDHDIVEASNLHRQPLYSSADVGQPKAQAAARRLRAYNPSIRVLPHSERFDAASADGLLSPGDVVVDCSDNFATKFLINDAAVRAGRPAVIASVYQYEGQLQVVRADSGGSCLRCQWPEATKDGLVGNCRQAGVLGPVPAVLGSLQAMEVLKLLLGLPGQMRDEVLLIDLLDLSQRRMLAPRHAACIDACVRIAARDSTAVEDVDVTCPLAEAAARGFRVVDIREHHECAAEPMPTAEHESVPMGRLLAGALPDDASARYLLVCTHGIRSRAAAEALRALGRNNVWSLRGGLAAAGGRGASESEVLGRQRHQ